ncbi:nucleotide pyrophosphohydrolase [Desulfobulbus rhabdoformis]|uniref:MazG nucleotide pyrophosphohydrolase domain-containing protein n=1 Tax=Desulfobulbus rhabdoformis TaxID=34032 RepID=UPI0019628F94|nr:MazG nucleotide pyrophosphohydrolase domain-containing protein [Desulfobulbus rhabdoformis]MBM9613607.1 nucleotide pyrophosphohydrolase [Desulfobulbus rhabdoformis]
MHPAPTGETLADLMAIIATLRGENGCPWDKKQTSQSLKKYFVEECQELIEAIEQGECTSICEELGDVFFLLSFFMHIYREEQQFTSEDVFRTIIQKMVRRHPHVFAGSPVTDEQSLRDQWNRIKAEEKEGTQSQD